MFSDDLVLHVTNQTNLYAVQHSKGTFWRIKLGLSLQLYCCQGIARFRIKIFIGQMHLMNTIKKSHVQWGEIDFERYYQIFIWMTTHRLQKINTTKYEYYLKSRISISNSMVQLSITALMKALSLTMENTAGNNLLEESPLGFDLNFVHHLIWRISISWRTILWSRYWFARYWSGSECNCCVGFDWKVWSNSWINRYIWESVYQTLIVRWADQTSNWCTWHSSMELFPWLPSS